MPALQWELLDHNAADAVRNGDLVSAEAGGMPIYRVNGLEGLEVRLDAAPERPSAAIMPLDAFRWRGRLRA